MNIIVRKAFLSSVFCSFFLLLSACSTTSQLQKNANIDSIEDISQFSIRGKMAFIGKDRKKHSVSFRWRQQADYYDIIINSVLGIQVASIQGDDGFILIKSDGEIYESGYPDQLIERIIGWQVPVQQLSKWLLARHQGSQEQFNNQGRLKSFHQTTPNGETYQVSYQAYLKKTVANAELELPSKIKLSHDAFTIRIQIYEWEL